MGFEDRNYSRSNVPRSGLSQYSMITILIAINVIVFIADMFFEGRLATQLALDTEMTLYFLGRPVEQRLGRWEFLKFYLLAILAGGAGFYLVKLLSGWPLASVLGASGAVSGVVALFIFYYPRQTLLIWGILPVPAWLLGVIMLLMNLKYALVPGSGISWEAHLAGAAFGIAYFFFSWNFSRLQMPQSIADKMAGSGALKIHNPGASNPNEKLTQQADAILEKINIQGEDSLTGRERKTLKRYSEMVRQQRQ